MCACVGIWGGGGGGGGGGRGAMCTIMSITAKGKSNTFEKQIVVLLKTIMPLFRH